MLKFPCFIRTCLCITAGALVAWSQTPESAFDRDPWPAATRGPLKVFILAGQSNMQGHAALRTLEYLVYHPDTAADYQHWKDREGRWTQRSDVWIWTTDGARGGKLQPGYGEPRDALTYCATPTRIRPLE